jgi:hypothetical protein
VYEKQDYIYELKTKHEPNKKEYKYFNDQINEITCNKFFLD